MLLASGECVLHVHELYLVLLHPNVNVYSQMLSMVECDFSSLEVLIFNACTHCRYGATLIADCELNPGKVVTVCDIHSH